MLLHASNARSPRSNRYETTRPFDFRLASLVLAEIILIETREKDEKRGGVSRGAEVWGKRNLFNPRLAVRKLNRHLLSCVVILPAPLLSCHRRITLQRRSFLDTPHRSIFPVTILCFRYCHAMPHDYCATRGAKRAAQLTKNKNSRGDRRFDRRGKNEVGSHEILLIGDCTLRRDAWFPLIPIREAGELGEDRLAARNWRVFRERAASSESAILQWDN